MDPNSEAVLANVNPKLAQLVRGISIPIYVVQGLRSFEEQAKLYAQGRTTPGSIVTNAPPGHSWHEFGLAVDVVPLSVIHLPNWGPDEPVWKTLEEDATDLGLSSGFDWHHPDRPHLQLTGRFPVSPTDEVREIYKTHGLNGVWASAGV